MTAPNLELIDIVESLWVVENLSTQYNGVTIVKKRIHVNQHNIRANLKDGGNRPVITVKTYKSNDYAHEVDIKGPSKLIYSPDKPLSCGAKVWIATDSEVDITRR